MRLESGLPVAGLPLVNPLAWPGLFVTNARQPPAPNHSPPSNLRHSELPTRREHSGVPDRRNHAGSDRRTGSPPRISSLKSRSPAYKHLSLDLNYQWNPYTSPADKEEIELQYRPDSSRVVNLGYRFQQGILKQYDTSFAWPDRGALECQELGRWVYSPRRPDDNRANSRIRIQKLLLSHPDRAATVPAADFRRRYRGTGYLDCITIGTEGLEFGRKACGFVPAEGDSRLPGPRPGQPRDPLDPLSTFRIQHFL